MYHYGSRRTTYKEEAPSLEKKRHYHIDVLYCCKDVPLMLLDELYPIRLPMILNIVQGNLVVEDAQGLLLDAPPSWFICHGDLDVPLLHHDMPVLIRMLHHVCF